MKIHRTTTFRAASKIDSFSPLCGFTKNFPIFTSQTTNINRAQQWCGDVAVQKLILKLSPRLQPHSSPREGERIKSLHRPIHIYRFSKVVEDERECSEKSQYVDVKVRKTSLRE
jgi:hypothetical protein